MISKRTIAGQEFSVRGLKPFGEKWKPTSGGVLIDSWAQNDLFEVVDAVRAVSLAVITDSTIASDWERVPVLPGTERPHVDLSPYGGAFTIHMLHGEGPRGSTAYAKNNHLMVGAQACIPDLKALIAEAPEEIRSRYGLNLLLEQYTEENPQYSNSGYDSYYRIQGALVEMEGQLNGSLWKSGQDLRQIRRDFTILLPIYRGLHEFYQKMAKHSPKYIQSWRKPNVTVLAYQDTGAVLMEGDPNSVVYHFRSANPASPNERDLRRKYIVQDRRYPDRYRFATSSG